MERFLPLALGGLSTFAASILDINYGAIAGGITLVAGAGGAAYWEISRRRTAVFRDAEAAKLEAFRNDAAEKQKIFRESKAAELAVFRETEAARIEVQRQQDEANKGSLSAQLQTMGGQLTAIQRSADEANRSLSDAREFNSALKARLEDANRRVEDANDKLHKVLNELNAKNLVHEAEKQEMEQKFEAARRELMDDLEAKHAENRRLSEELARAMSATQAQADRNSARLDTLAGPAGPGGPA